MRKNWLISRRTALKGAGVALLLPLLEQMGWAETPAKGGFRPPARLCYIYIPYGTHPDQFWPKQPLLTPGGELPPILEPLRPVIGKVMPIAGLELLRDLGVTGAGMGGHHANEVAAWLSGHLIKQNDPNNAITADQVAADAIGHTTTLPSLELSFEKAKRSDTFDKGFNGAFFEHVAWRSPSVPMPSEIDPKAVFERLFSTRRPAAPLRRAPAAGGVDPGAFAVKAGAEPAEPMSLDRSMLDLVMEGSAALARELGGADRRKLDDYQESIRALEKRIVALDRQQAEQAREAETKKPWKTSAPLAVTVPAAIPGGFKEYAQVMLDLVALAFQSGTTRISSMMFGKPFGRSYPELGFSEGHHELSHWRDDPPGKLAKILKLNVYHTQQLAYFLQRLQSLEEGPGSLLDNCMVVYGSGMRDGNAHDHKNLPTLLCGGGAGTIRGGRVLQANKAPISNLHAALLARMGVEAKGLSDSTGMLELG